MGHDLTPLIDKVCEEASIMKPVAVLSKLGIWDSKKVLAKMAIEFNNSDDINKYMQMFRFDVVAADLNVIR